MISLFKCVSVLMIGFNPILTDIDKKVIKRAKYVCKTQYNGCLKYIEKTDKLGYRVLCGQRRKDEI